MKNLICLIMSAIIPFLLFFTLAPSASSMDDPGFTIGRMVLCKSIINREPMEISQLFSVATKKVYCFLEARDIEDDTEVRFVWYHNDTEVDSVRLPLKKGPRWRTFSSKNLVGLKGAWKVELQDSSGIVHNTLSFSVE